MSIETQNAFRMWRRLGLTEEEAREAVEPQQETTNVLGCYGCGLDVIPREDGSCPVCGCREFGRAS